MDEKNLSIKMDNSNGDVEPLLKSFIKGADEYLNSIVFINKEINEKLVLFSNVPMKDVAEINKTEKPEIETLRAKLLETLDKLSFLLDLSRDNQRKINEIF